ncbi:MAG TPA: hypothetical protein VHL34_24645 [Rhizomicrobium sp.]|jgi:hypothetical protein|nr:hypothetical protein [Rhizomicrobium sp.]
MTPLTVARLAEAERILAVTNSCKSGHIDGCAMCASDRLKLSRTLLPDLLALVQGLVGLRLEIRKQIAELERLHVVWGFEGAPFDAELRLLRQFEALIPKGDE